MNMQIHPHLCSLALTCSWSLPVSSPMKLSNTLHNGRFQYWNTSAIYVSTRNIFWKPWVFASASGEQASYASSPRVTDWRTSLITVHANDLQSTTLQVVRIGSLGLLRGTLVIAALWIQINHCADCLFCAWYVLSNNLNNILVIYFPITK